MYCVITCKAYDNQSVDVLSDSGMRYIRIDANNITEPFSIFNVMNCQVDTFIYKIKNELCDTNCKYLLAELDQTTEQFTIVDTIQLVLSSTSKLPIGFTLGELS